MGGNIVKSLVLDDSAREGKITYIEEMKIIKCCCKKRIQIKDRRKLNENIRVEETREIIEDFIKNTINKSASSEKNNHE